MTRLKSSRFVGTAPILVAVALLAGIAVLPSSRLANYACSGYGYGYAPYPYYGRPCVWRRVWNGYAWVRACV